MQASAPDTAGHLDTARQVKYWKMCLGSALPHHYLGSEGNRMSLAYFLLAAMDTLAPASRPPVTSTERPGLRAWILAHQHPAGGFCGSPSLVFAARHQEWEFETGDGGGRFEPVGLANLAATAFALQLLAMLAEDEDGDGEASGAYRHVDRVATLRWLKRLQRPDGSFGEVLRRMPGSDTWFVGGGYDMRYCYLAALVRWALRGPVREGDEAWVDDFDVPALADYISNSQTYDGGFSESATNEPHAGYTFCAVAALSLLDRSYHRAGRPSHASIFLDRIRDRERLEHWLVSRQFVYLDPPSQSTDVKDDAAEAEADGDDNFLQPPSLASLALDETQPAYAGLNGRTNKRADTCYCWWVAATLALLGRDDLLATAPARRFLLEKAQHAVGGFGKHAGDPPDVYHSCLALAALAVMGEPTLKPMDPALAVSTATAAKMERAREGLLAACGRAAGRDQWAFVDLTVRSRGEPRPTWLE